MERMKRRRRGRRRGRGRRMHTYSCVQVEWRTVFEKPVIRYREMEYDEHKNLCTVSKLLAPACAYNPRKPCEARTAPARQMVCPWAWAWSARRSYTAGEAGRRLTPGHLHQHRNHDGRHVRRRTLRPACLCWCWLILSGWTRPAGESVGRPSGDYARRGQNGRA